MEQLVLFPKIKLPAGYVNPDIAGITGITPADRDPAHPWHYIAGGRPLPAHKIPPRKFHIYAQTTGKKLLQEKISERKRLFWETRGYRKTIKAGPESFTGKCIVNSEDNYDYKGRPICSAEFLEWASALALMNAHISYYKAILRNKQMLCPQCGTPLRCTANLDEFPCRFLCMKCGGKYQATSADDLAAIPARAKPKSRKR